MKLCTCAGRLASGKFTLALARCRDAEELLAYAVKTEDNVSMYPYPWRRELSVADAGKLWRREFSFADDVK